MPLDRKLPLFSNVIMLNCDCYTLLLSHIFPFKSHSSLFCNSCLTFCWLCCSLQPYIVVTSFILVYVYDFSQLLLYFVGEFSPAYFNSSLSCLSQRSSASLSSFSNCLLLHAVLWKIEFFIYAASYFYWFSALLRSLADINS